MDSSIFTDEFHMTKMPVFLKKIILRTSSIVRISLSATKTEVESDTKKATNLRENRLRYGQSLLPYPSCIQHIEVISAQIHVLVLTAYGSRMTKDEIIIFIIRK
ncbi:hypothetical protein BDB01DRAFT_892837 [Pilobolus umbonatus]|nr:hypothetical protein BDB01DRAFT_892837 [Pilobolus umbonatus]